jgi:3-isopropylmalate/(R)-2-methylmalate dehydratase small subunit
MRHPFTRLVSRTVLLDQSDVDTDQIIPARFLTTTTREGLGRHCFADWRFDRDGQPKPDFPLNRSENAGAAILVAGRNFGCGSSREHAPWALLDAGIQAVLAPSIADIFRNNALKNGLLALPVSEELYARLVARQGHAVEIDLVAQRIVLDDGSSAGFELEAFVRRCLMEGVDDFDFLLGCLPAIANYEGARAWTP